jgi:hypothetical protein
MTVNSGGEIRQLRPVICQQAAKFIDADFGFEIEAG